MSFWERLSAIVKGRPKPLEEDRGAQGSTAPELRAGRERKPAGVEQPGQLSPSTSDNIAIVCGIALGCGVCWLILRLWGGLRIL